MPPASDRAVTMPDYLFLIPISISIGLGFVGLVAVFWSLNDGRYTDLEGAAQRIPFDDGEEWRSPVQTAGALRAALGRSIIWQGDVP